MDYKHPDVRGAYERTFARPDDSSIIFPEERFLQAADLNDMRGILGRRVERAARLSARDGDRRTGAAIRVLETGDVDLQAGEIFAGGDVLPVTAAVLSGVPMVGAALIGVRLVKTYIDADEDAGLLGLAPGTLAEGEPGALREVTTLSWGFEGDGADGELYPVYRLKDGVPLNQQSAELSETAQAVALADFGAHGSYIVEGCGVTALGRDDAGAQQFDIGAGTASIGGFYRTRASALRHSEVESWTTRQIDGEQHVFTAGDNGQCELRLFEGPIDQIVQVLLERETTKTITRGQTSGGADNLGETSVLSVVSLKQGNKTYTEGADFTLSGHKISWAIAGDEPAKGSSYEVQFRFRDVVVPAAVTANSITLSGGRDGGEVIATYQVKQARTDLVCLDREGQPVYLRGLAGSGEPPRAPDGLLRLAEVHNDFAGTPRVENNGPGRYTMQDIGELASL
ncbi:DUF4815 domain-containing protein, partial [Polycladidibacter hongkongensis]|uniref:DUF4815 domain-containing protein n=1 Tax=Polycladidibacter hongkongensis TaxID=1647556 RepID=UPI0012E335DB